MSDYESAVLETGTNHRDRGPLRRRINAGMLSSKSDEWATPQWLFDELNEEFGFTLDPCSTQANAKCSRHFTLAEDGLKQDWSRDVVFMNPPYGRAVKSWMKKAYEESLKGATVVCLVAARPDPAWWHEYSSRGEVRFLRRRVAFGDGVHPAPFPSAIVVFRPNMTTRLQAASEAGTDEASQSRSRQSRRQASISDAKAFVSLEAVAVLLGVSPTRVQQWLTEDKLPCQTSPISGDAPWAEYEEEGCNPVSRQQR